MTLTRLFWLLQSLYYRCKVSSLSFALLPHRPPNPTLMGNKSLTTFHPAPATRVSILSSLLSREGVNEVNEQAREWVSKWSEALLCSGEHVRRESVASKQMLRVTKCPFKTRLSLCRNKLWQTQTIVGYMYILVRKVNVLMCWPINVSGGVWHMYIWIGIIWAKNNSKNLITHFDVLGNFASKHHRRYKWYNA